MLSTILNVERAEFIFRCLIWEEMDDVINAGRANYDLDLIAIVRKFQIPREMKDIVFICNAQIVKKSYQ